MLLLALRSMFFLAVLVGYSSGIWRLINDYFQREFKSFLDEEAKKNKYLLEDPKPSEINVQPVPTMNTVPAEDAIRQSSPPVTSNRLLDEVIVGFGRLFTSHQGKQRGTTPSTTTTTATKQGQDKTLISIPPPVIGATSESSATPGGSNHQEQSEAEVIEGDELRRSFPSPPSLDEEDEQEQEEKEEAWMNYWKNRDRQAGPGENEGYCVRDRNEEELSIDSCGHKSTP